MMIIRGDKVKVVRNIGAGCQHMGNHVGEVVTVERNYAYGYQFGFITQEYECLFQIEEVELLEEKGKREEVKTNVENKFKVGDKIIGNDEIRYHITKKGWEGEVVKVIDKEQIRVCIINGAFVNVESKYFDLLSSQSKPQGIMKKLSILAKKTFDKKTQNYIKLGWLDERLEVTQEGQKAVATVAFTNETLEEYAQREVTEAEKEKEDTDK